MYPREIEEVLYAHRALAEAAVVGIPHPVHGEEVGAAVVRRAGHEADADELGAYVKARVASSSSTRAASGSSTRCRRARRASSSGVISPCRSRPPPSRERGDALAEAVIVDAVRTPIGRAFKAGWPACAPTTSARWWSTSCWSETPSCRSTPSRT